MTAPRIMLLSTDDIRLSAMHAPRAAEGDRFPSWSVGEWLRARPSADPAMPDLVDVPLAVASGDA